jgi:hypothetical protein
MKTTLIVPDIQYPYHDKLALSKLIKVAEDIQPDSIVQIGDGIDFPQVSQWSKGTAGEFAPTLQEHIDGYRTDVLEPLRKAAPDADILWLEGNHDLRLQDFVKKYAAPLGVLRALDVANLFALEDLNISYVRGPVRIGTNTFAVHGHEASGYCSSASACSAGGMSSASTAPRSSASSGIPTRETRTTGVSTRAAGFSGISNSGSRFSTPLSRSAGHFSAPRSAGSSGF